MPKYKILLINLHHLKKLIYLVNNIKFFNNLYYFSKINLKIIETYHFFFSLNYFLPN